MNGYSAYSGVTVKASYSTGGDGDSGGLQNGVPVTGLSGAKGSKTYFTVTVPAGSSMTISTSGGTGDADLYVRQGAKPTTKTYDCRPYKAGNNETCSGNNESGTYYIMLSAYRAFSGVTLKASW